MFQCVAIIGVGMMGGALGLALKQRGLALRVVGVDTSEETLQTAQKMGAIDAGTADIAAVRDADCVIFAAPVPLVPALMAQAAPHVPANALVTDIGSVKAGIVEAGNRWFGSRFVGGHPMAGSERSGVEAADAAIFAGAAWAIVSSENASSPNADGVNACMSDADSVRRLTEFVRALGARPIRLAALQHDRIVALVSHLPHLLSFAFADTVATSPDPELARDMAGGSFRDFARVSAADRTLWDGIFADNRKALLAALDAYETRLSTLRNAIQNVRD